MADHDNDALGLAHLANLADQHGLGANEQLAAVVAPLNEFQAAIQLNQIAVAFVSQIFLRIANTVFPSPQNAMQLTELQQQFYASLARVPRSHLVNNANAAYFVLPFGVAADIDITFPYLASHEVWGLFLVLEINNGSISCRYLGQVGGNAALAGPLQLYHHITFMPPAHFLRPGLGFLVVFNHLVQAFQAWNQPPPVPLPVPLAPPAAALGMFDQAALALLNHNRLPAAAAAPGATLADNFRIAQGTVHFFDAPVHHSAFYFPEKPADEDPSPGLLRHQASLQSARDAFRGPDQLNPKQPDFTDKQVQGLMSFDFGTGHGGKVSLADIHLKDKTVNSTTQLVSSFSLLSGFCLRWFGPSAAAGVNQLCSSLTSILLKYPQLRVDEVIPLGDMQLKALVGLFPTTRDLRDVFVDGLTIPTNDPRVFDYLLTRPAPGLGNTSVSRGTPSGSARVHGRSSAVKSTRHRGGYTPFRSGHHGPPSDNPPPLISHKPYQDWQAAKPSLNSGAEPCYNYLLGVGPCANTQACVGSGPRKVKRPHAYPPEATAAQQTAFTAWLQSRPSTKSTRG